MIIEKIIFVALIASPMLCHGQFDGKGYDTSKIALNKKLTDYARSIKAGYIYPTGNLVDVGLLRQKFHQDLYYHPGELYGTSGPSIACEINLYFGKKIIGPKIAYETHILGFLAAKANLIYYTDLKQSALCFTPELGVSISGFVVLSSRYSIPLYNKDFLFEDSSDGIGLAVTINLPIKFRKLTVRELRKRNEKKQHHNNQWEMKNK
jgi:hypothetical protein